MFIVSNSGEQFKFNLLDGDKTLLRSEQYTTKSACLNGVESVKTNSQDESKFDHLTSSNGKFYFNLKASNGQVIGTSSMYDSEDDCHAGAMKVASQATGNVDDQTV
jgi:uncharacterized protein